MLPHWGSGQGISTRPLRPERVSTSCHRVQRLPSKTISPVLPEILTVGAPSRMWTTVPSLATMIPCPMNSLLPRSRRGLSPMPLTQSSSLSTK